MGHVKVALGGIFQAWRGATAGMENAMKGW